MSNIFGSGSTKTEPADFSIPPFTSVGGVTPQQLSLGEYSYGQDLLAQKAEYGGEGMGMSTNATQGAGGAFDTAELGLTGSSDTNQNAMWDLYQENLSGLEQGLTNAVNLNIAPGTTPSTAQGSLALGGTSGQPPPVNAGAVLK